MADKKESVEVKTEKAASSEQSDDAADTAESSGSNAVTSAVSGVKSAVSSAVTGAYGAVIGVFSKFASSIGIPTKILALLLSVVTVASAVVISDSQTYNKSNQNEDKQSNPAMIPLSDVNSQEDSKLDEVYEYKIGRAKKIYRYLRSYNWPEIAIAGVLANANADSNVDSSRYEGDDIINDLVMLRTHHLNWNEYTTALFNIYSGASDNDVYGGIKTTSTNYATSEGTYAVEVESEYTGRKVKLSPSGSMYKAAGDVYAAHSSEVDALHSYYDSKYNKYEYYPGIGLFMWSGERAHNLLDFADCQHFVTDKDNDGHNDVAFEPVFQIAYMLYENKSNIVEKATSGQYDSDNYIIESGNKTNYKDWPETFAWASLIVDTFSDYKNKANSNRTVRPDNKPEAWDMKYCYSIDVNLSEPDEGNKNSWVLYEYFGVIVDYTTKLSNGTAETCPYNPASKDGTHKHDVIEKNYDIKLTPVYYSIRFNTASLDKTGKRANLENLIKSTKVEKFKEKFEQFASTFTSDVDYKFEEIKNISQYVNYRYDSPDEVHNISDQFPSYEYEITGYWDWICEDITTKTVKSIDTSSVKDKYDEYNSAYTKYLSEKKEYKNAYIEYQQKLDAQKKMIANEEQKEKVQKQINSLTECITRMNDVENRMKSVWRCLELDYNLEIGKKYNWKSSIGSSRLERLYSLQQSLLDVGNSSDSVKKYLGGILTKNTDGSYSIDYELTSRAKLLRKICNAWSRDGVPYNNPLKETFLKYANMLFEIANSPSYYYDYGTLNERYAYNCFYKLNMPCFFGDGRTSENFPKFAFDELGKTFYRFNFNATSDTYSLSFPRFDLSNGSTKSTDGTLTAAKYDEVLTNLKTKHEQLENKTSFSGSWTGSVTVSLTSQGHTNKITISGAGSGSKTFTKSELTNIPEPSIAALKTAYNNLRIAANDFSKAKRSYDKNVVNNMLEGSRNDSRRAYFRWDGRDSTNSYSNIKYFNNNGKTNFDTFAGTLAGLGTVKTGRNDIHYNLTNPYDQEYLKPSDQRGFDTYWYLDGNEFGKDTSTITDVNHEVFDVGNEATTLWTGSEKYLKYHHRYKIAWKNFKGASILNDTRTNLNLGGIGSGNGYTKFLDTVFTKIYDIYTETTKDTAKVFSSERNGGIIGSGNEDPEKLHIGIEIDSSAGGAFDFYTRKDGSNDLVESKVSYMAYRLQEDLAYQFAVWFYQSWKGYDFVKMTETDFLNHTDSARYWYQLMIVNNWNDEWNTYKSDIIRLDRAQLGLERSVIDQWYIDDELYTNVVESMIPEEDEEMYNVSTGTILDMYGNKLRHIGSFDNSTIADTAMSLAFPLGSYNYGVSDVTSCDQDGSLYANRCTELYVAVANTAYSILQRGTDISNSGVDGLKFGGIAAPSESDLPGRVYYQKSEDGTSQPVSADLYSYSDYARVRYDSPWQALWVVIFASGRDEKFPIYTSQHNNDAMSDSSIWKTALGHLGYDSPCLDPTQAESHLTTTEGSYSWEYVGMIVPDDISASTSSDNIYRIPVSQIPVKLKPGDICVNYRNAFIYLGDAVKNNTKLSYYYKYDNTDYAIAMAMESDDMTGHGLAVIVNPPDHEKDDTSNAPLLYPASGSKSTAKDNPITTLMDEFCDEEGGYYVVFRSINDDYELTDGYQLFRTLDFSTYPDGSRRSELKYSAGKFHLISNIASDILSNNADIAYHSLSSDWTTKLDDISNEQERNIQSMRAAFFNRVAVRKKLETTP